MTATVTKTAGLYDRMVENLTRYLNEAQQDAREARDSKIRWEADLRVGEFRTAIRLAEQANTIPGKRVGDRIVADEPVQFGFVSQTGTVPMHPNLDGFSQYFPAIEWENYTVITDDPLQIATLDDVAEKFGRCKRVPMGSIFARQPDLGADGIWVSGATYEQMRANRMAV